MLNDLPIPTHVARRRVCTSWWCAGIEATSILLLDIFISELYSVAMSGLSSDGDGLGPGRFILNGGDGYAHRRCQLKLVSATWAVMMLIRDRLCLGFGLH